MKQPLLNPAVVAPLLWIAVVAAALLSGLDFYPLDALFFAYLAAAVGTFSVFALIGAAAGGKLQLTERLYQNSRSLAVKLHPRQLVAIHLSCILVSLLFQSLDHQIIAGPGWWRPDGLIIYRISITENSMAVNYRWTAVLNYFFFALAPILRLSWRQLGMFQRVTSVLGLAAFVYLSTARASFFTITLLFGLFLLHGRPRIWLAILASLVLFFAFQLLGALVGKSGSEAFWIYLFAPMFAMDQILHGVRTDLPGTAYTFSFLQPFLVRLGFLPARQANLLSYYSTPYPTNVYTVFGPFVLDFGIAGSIVCMGVFGFASGILRGLQQRHPRDAYLMFLSSLSLTLLVLGVFYDYYTSAGYVWFTILFATFLFPRTFSDGVDTRRNTNGIGVGSGTTTESSVRSA